MKIAAISTSRVPSLTANSIQVMKTCNALVKNGYEVHLWVPGNPPENWDKLVNHYGLDTSFTIHRKQSYPFLKRYDFSWLTLLAARRQKCDLVYTWLPQTAVLALLFGLPTILEMHDMPTGHIGPLLFRMFIKSKGRKRLITITDALRQKLENRFGMSLRSPVTLIAPNGTDPEHYANLPPAWQARDELGLPQIPTAVYTGHFYAGRGMDLMFALAKKSPDIHFLWVGGTPQSVLEWQERLASSGIKNVTLTGFVENRRLPLYQSAGDILLMPFENMISGSSGGNSAEICSPMKMFDYLACGRAILASDLPVLHEVLNEGNAVFCPIGDISSWEAALKDLITNPKRCSNLGDQAKLDSTNYSWVSRAKRALEGL